MLTHVPQQETTLPYKQGGLGLGLTGTHRTGKTTTAELVAQQNDIPFLANIGSSLASMMGIDFSKPVSLAERLAYQMRRLDLMEKAYKETKGSIFVADRTPLDTAAYTLAEFASSTPEPELVEDCNAYVKRCFDLTNLYFAHLFYFRPALPYKEAPGKPPANTAYQDHINVMIGGLLIDVRSYCMFTVIPLGKTDLHERADIINQVGAEVVFRISQNARSFAAC